MNTQSNFVQESLTVFTEDEIAKLGKSKAYGLLISGDLIAIKLGDNAHITPANSNSIQESLTLFTVDEVAKIFKVGRSKAYGMVISGELVAIKLGGNTRVTSAAIKDCIKNQPLFPVEPALVKRKKEQQTA